MTSNKRETGFEAGYSLTEEHWLLANVKSAITEVVVHNNEANPHTLSEFSQLQTGVFQ